jgi:uncharacterized protein
MIDISYALTGGITGLLIGLTGVGGGALTTPILMLFFGVSPVTAIGTDLWFSAITKITGAYFHHSNRHVDWSIAKLLWRGSLPASLSILLIMQLEKWQTHPIFNQLIAVVILMTAIGLLFAPILSSYARGRRIEAPEKFKALQPSLTTISGIILGICVTLTSIGAGALGSVLLVYLYPLRMTPHRLVATDIVHAIPLAIFAGMGYLVAGKVDGMMLLSLLAGSLPAIILGSFLSQKLSGRWIQVLLAVVLAITGLKVLTSL